MRTSYDLRHAWHGTLVAFAPAGDDEGTPPDDDTDAAPPAGDDTSGEPADDTNHVRDKKLQEASRDAARYRISAKAEKDRADTAEAALTELRIYNAFVLAAFGKVNDLDAAWKLADSTSVRMTDDGVVSGFDDVITTTLERYPYLVPDTEPEPFEPNGFLPLGPSGRPPSKKTGKDPSRAALEARFPALKHR